MLGKIAEAVWEIENLEKLEAANLKPFGFSDKTVETLCLIGLPKWCAPNMHLHPLDGFTKFSGETNGIHIGDDRDELLICLNKKTEMIYALNFDGERLSVAKSIEEFLYLLITYAEFIDRYLSANPEFNFNSAYLGIDAANDLISSLKTVCPKLMQEHDWWAKHLKMLTPKNPN